MPAMRRLVSGAGPILWDRLSETERQLLKYEADPWITSVVADAIRSPRRPTSPEYIDHDRSGRVLFITGPRGAGKTSILLTLLEGWKGNPAYREPDAKIISDCHDFRVLLPILDFDPLPHGMPLLGWLLEPWRRLNQHTQRTRTVSGEETDLSELFAEVFDRAVIGWTRATVEGKGVVERASAYAEQAQGWIETRMLWHTFVNSWVCQIAHGSQGTCNDSHRVVFIVPIDDVDLQVEHIPDLLHAIRLLHHPNVAYVLTGDYDHLGFAVILDYMGRHIKLLGERAAERKDIWARIQRDSERLGAALVEKVLPRHARIPLPLFDGPDLLTMDCPRGAALTPLAGKVAQRTVGTALAAPWRSLFEEFTGLPIATARRAQFAIDRYVGRNSPAGEAPKDLTLDFVADLCGTEVQGASGASLGIVGRITTRLGTVLRAWKRDVLTIVLADRPLFEFTRYGEDDSKTKCLLPEESHQALLLQRAVESQLVRAIGLEWRPDAGILATKVDWDSTILAADRPAVFHWPWLVRPMASQVLRFDALCQQFIDRFPLPRDWTQEDVLIWLAANVDWYHEQHGEKATKGHRRADATKGKGDGSRRSGNKVSRTPSSAATFKDISATLKSLDDVDTRRWVRELLVMSAPYFGLPESVAEALHSAFSNYQGVSKVEVELEQRRAIKNAIIASYTGAERTSGDFVKAADAFDEEQRDRSRGHFWWQWLKRS
jgi:hypothetical protein